MPLLPHARRVWVRRLLALASAGAVTSVLLIFPARAEPQEQMFAVKLGGVAGSRRALVCRPNGPPPYAAVVFNHGSIVDMMGWPGAAFPSRGRGPAYRLDSVCEALAAAGYLAFAPIRETAPRGPGFNAYEDVYREIALQAIDHVKRMPEADPSRIALAGFSMGGLVSFAAAIERTDLRAVALLAPAAGRGKLGEVAKGADGIGAPVLAMIEKSDSPQIHMSIKILEQALGSRGKSLRLVRYDRGGGHELFYDVGYWWDDFKAFLHEHLGRR